MFHIIRWVWVLLNTVLSSSSRVGVILVLLKSSNYLCSGFLVSGEDLLNPTSQSEKGRDELV